MTVKNAAGTSRDKGMRKLLAELGYRFDLGALRREYADLNGKEPSPGTERWFEAISPFLVIAHQKGMRHEPLRGVFPFLEERERSRRGRQKAEENPLKNFSRFRGANSYIPGYHVHTGKNSDRSERKN